MSGDAYIVHAAHLCARVMADEPEAPNHLFRAAASYDGEMREAVALVAATVVIDQPQDIDGEGLWHLARWGRAKLGWLRSQRDRASGKLPGGLVDPACWTDKLRDAYGVCAVMDPGEDDPSIDDAELIERAASGENGAELALTRRIAFSEPLGGGSLLPALVGFVFFYTSRPLSAADLRHAAEFVGTKIERFALEMAA
jgi:hypothetical protein